MLEDCCSFDEAAKTQKISPSKSNQKNKVSEVLVFHIRIVKIKLLPWRQRREGNSFDRKEEKERRSGTCFLRAAYQLKKGPDTNLSVIPGKNSQN